MPIVEQDSDQTKSRLKLDWGIAVSSPCLGSSAARPIPGAHQVPIPGTALVPPLILGWYSWTSLTQASPSLGRLGLAQLSPLLELWLQLCHTLFLCPLFPLSLGKRACSRLVSSWLLAHVTLPDFPSHHAEVEGDHQREQPVYFKLWYLSSSLKSLYYFI